MVELNGVGTLNAALFSAHSPLTQPQESLFQSGDRQSVLAALEIAVLEMLQPVDDHVDQILIADTINAALLEVREQ